MENVKFDFGAFIEAGRRANEETEKDKQSVDLEKENVVLKAQIEKMKCPQNCRYGSISVWCDESISIDCEKEKYLHEDNYYDFCKNCKKWEIKEK